MAEFRPSEPSLSRILCTLDLDPLPISDVASDGEGPLALMRVTGGTPRLALTASGGGTFCLAPGEYAFELEIRAENVSFCELIYDSAIKGERRVRLERCSEYGWRAAIMFAQPVMALSVELGASSGAFLISRCRIDVFACEPTPRHHNNFSERARTLYRKLPRSVRLLAGRLVSGIAHATGLRASMRDHERRPQGQIRVSAVKDEISAELEARRVDFDARFAVARGLSEEAAPIRLSSESSDARVIAFYLPQYHRIPENDAWWGPGFTEWTNVAKAVPQFVGHHQPRLPGELGFYDLTAPSALRRQVDLARTYGVSAFCFHYYWFAGKRLLERPMDAFLGDCSLDLNFTICWANENWTRRWDGADDQVLMTQSHSPEDHARVFDDIARYLEDPRAIRIDGKPLIVVYRPAIIGDARRMVDIWRERAHARGWPGLYLAATNAFQFYEPKSLGFDALVEFPPHNLAPERVEKNLSWLNASHAGRVFDYERVANEAAQQLGRLRSGRFPVFPGVMPSWDNEARRPGAGIIFHNATPEAYARWLNAACEAAARVLPQDRRLIFVNAWNEWAEGAYLEPDRKWGRAFLEATAAVVCAAQPARGGMHRRG